MYSRRGYTAPGGSPLPPPGYGGTAFSGENGSRTYLKTGREAAGLPPPTYSRRPEHPRPRYPLDTAEPARPEPSGTPPFGERPPAEEPNRPGEDDILLGALLLLLLGENEPGGRETMVLLGYLFLAGKK